MFGAWPLDNTKKLTLPANNRGQKYHLDVGNFPLVNQDICLVKLIKQQKHPDHLNNILGLAFEGFSKRLQKC